jgi:molybdenum cofactor cytidylyltransferase
MSERAPGDQRVGAIVLAAGEGRRFGGHKLLAPLHGQPLLQHVLDVLATRPAIAPVIVVLGGDADALARTMTWRGEQRIVNPDPARGISSSLRAGLLAISVAERGLDGVLILLGDQPLVQPTTLDALVGAAPGAAATGRVVVVPRYADPGFGRNPVLLLKSGWAFADGAGGDQGLGPLIGRRPELVLEVPVAGANPDIDTPSDLHDLERG